MNVKILFVEDDERLRDVLLEAAMEEYDAQGVSSAEAAVELLRDEPFEVMVTDVTLPGMSGLDLLWHCQRLRPGVLLQESPLSYYSPPVHQSASGNHTLEAEQVPV